MIVEFLNNLDLSDLLFKVSGIFGADSDVAGRGLGDSVVF